MGTEREYLKWFRENVKEDEKDIINIGELAIKALYEKIYVTFKRAELPIATAGIIYEAILEYLVKMQNEGKDSFNINIADRLEIGYSSSDNEDDEKVGNFMIYIRHLYNTKKDDLSDDARGSAAELCTQWNSANIVTQADVISKISDAALVKLSKEIDIHGATLDFVIPAFIIIYEQLVGYLKLKRRELNKFEYEINFASCFTAGCRENEEDTDDIYFVPNITSKLRLKDDRKATGKYE